MTSEVGINCRLVFPALLTTKKIDSALPWVGNRLTLGIFVGSGEDERVNVDARNRIAALSLYRGSSSDSSYFSMQVFITCWGRLDSGNEINSSCHLAVVRWLGNAAPSTEFRGLLLRRTTFGVG